MSGGKSLPATDLSGAFGKPSRAAGLRMPAKRTTGPRSPIKAVPAPSEPEAEPEAAATVAAPDPVVTATHDDVDDGQAEDHDDPQEAQKAPQAPVEAPGATQGRARGRTTLEPPAASPQPPPPAVPRARRGRPPSAAASTRTDAGRGRLVLWTPVSIRARMQSVRLNTGTLYLDQVLDAIETTYDQLADLVQQATGPTPVQGRLFERTGVNSTEPEQRVQLTIGGVLDSQLRTIDQLVDSTGAPSRSALVNAALNAALPA
jgi:hypothetical protein